MQNDWSSVEPLLAEWHRRARESQHVHYAAENRFARLNVWLGAPAVALSGIVGTSIFASLELRVDAWIKIVVGSISIVAAVLGVLQTYLGFNERAEKHRKAASGYASVRRRIEEVLALPQSKRGSPERVVERIRRRLDALAVGSPAAPSTFRDRVLSRHRSKSPYFEPEHRAPPTTPVPSTSSPRVEAPTPPATESATPVDRARSDGLT